DGGDWESSRGACPKHGAKYGAPSAADGDVAGAGRAGIGAVGESAIVKIMKVFRSLSGVAEEGTLNEPHASRSSVLDEPRTGVFRHVELGAAGVVVRQGPAIVAIPMAVLIALCQEAEPGLR